MKSALMALNMRELGPEVMADTFDIVLKCQNEGEAVLGGSMRALLERSRGHRPPAPLYIKETQPMAIPTKPQNVAVIGAGIMGAAIAWRLAQRGVHVITHRQGPAWARRVQPQLCLDQCRGERTHRLSQPEPPLPGNVAPVSPPTSAIMETRTLLASAGAARFPGYPTRVPPKGWWPGCGSSSHGATRPV